MRLTNDILNAVKYGVKGPAHHLLGRLTLIWAATRICKIRFGDDEFSPLKIDFSAAACIGEDEYEAAAILKCIYFQRNFNISGHDGMQALLSLPLVVHGYLQGLELKGYSIFWVELGDLDRPDFWGVESLTLKV